MPAPSSRPATSTLVQAIISAYRKNHGPDSHPKDLRAFVDRHDPRTFREAWGRLLGEVR